MGSYQRRLPVELRREIEREVQNAPKALKRAEELAKSGSKVVIKPKQGRRPNRGYEEGVAAEERFFDVCHRYLHRGRFPPWYLEMLRGTVADDANGIDAKARVLLFERDRLIPVQIKSSELGKAKFRAQVRWQHIPCIIVNDSFSDENIFTEVLQEISFIREQLLLAGR